MFVEAVWLEVRLHWRELDEVVFFLGLWIGRRGVAMLPFPVHEYAVEREKIVVFQF